MKFPKAFELQIFMKSLPKVKKIVYLLLTLLTIFNFVYIANVLHKLDERGLVDLNFYWYSGFYLQHGINPYQGFLDNMAFPFPTSVNGENDISFNITHPDQLGGFVAYTAPLLLILGLFSLMPLWDASIIWIVLNICFAFFVPILLVYYFKRKGLLIKNYYYPLSVLLFFSLNMTSRGIIANGQSSIFVLFLSILALILIEKKKKILSGLLLGIALSKYQVAFPVFVFLIFVKEWKVLFIAILVQILGVAALSIITETPMISIVRDYIYVTVIHATHQANSIGGIELCAYLPKTLFFPILTLIITTIPVGLTCYHGLNKAKQKKDQNNKNKIAILSILFLWSLLAVYHLGYDAVLTIVPILFFMILFENANGYQTGDNFLSRFGFPILFAFLRIPVKTATDSD